jgi:hypothetical protein
LESAAFVSGATGAGAATGAGVGSGSGAISTGCGAVFFGPFEETDDFGFFFGAFVSSANAAVEARRRGAATTSARSFADFMTIRRHTPTPIQVDVGDSRGDTHVIQVACHPIR